MKVLLHAKLLLKIAEISLYLILHPFILGLAPAEASDCDFCGRTAVMGDCTVNDPENIVTRSGQADSPETMCMSLRSHIAEKLTAPCFHISNKEYVEQNQDATMVDALTGYKPPEYTFEADFVSGLEGVYREDDNRPIHSRLILKMYFNGEQKELVKEWQTQGTFDVPSNSGTSWIGHMNKLENAFEGGGHIEDITREFEKNPVECKIKPDSESVRLGEMIDVEISEITDAMGKRSREFNRIIVQVIHGKILGGSPSKWNSDYRVFKVGEGTIKFEYQAPDSCEASEDSIYVYNSCDILPEDVVSLENTELNENISSKGLKLSCPGVTATLTNTWKYSSNTDEDDGRGKTIKKTWNYTKSITVQMEFEKTPDKIRQDFDMASMQLKPKGYDYKLKSYSISSGSYSAEGTDFEKWQNGPITEYVIDANSSESGTFSSLEESQPDFPMVIRLDISSGEIYYVLVPSFKARLEIHGQRKCQKTDDEGNVSDCGYSLDRTETVHIGTLGSDECLEVKGGDGKKSASGDCREVNNQPNSTLEANCSWEININD